MGGSAGGGGSAGSAGSAGSGSSTGPADSGTSGAQGNAGVSRSSGDSGAMAGVSATSLASGKAGISGASGPSGASGTWPTYASPGSAYASPGSAYASPGSAYASPGSAYGSGRVGVGSGRVGVGSGRVGVGAGARQGRELLLQEGDRDVAFAHRAGDTVQGLVGYLHVVAPQGGRRPEQGDVRGRYRAQVERSVIGVLIGQFAAASGRGEEDADQHGGDGDQEDNRHIRIVPCLPRDVACAAELRPNRAARTRLDA